MHENIILLHLNLLLAYYFLQLLMYFEWLFVSIVHYFDTPLTKKDVHNKLRESFEKNKKVTDIRVIDILVLKVLLLSFMNRQISLKAM